MSARTSKKNQHIEPSPSEVLLQRLQDMYHASLANASSNVTPDKRTPSNVAKLGLHAMGGINATSRIQWSRVMGNAYSFSNTSPASKTLVRPTSVSETSNANKVLAGRSYGNQQSSLNSTMMLRKQDCLSDDFNKASTIDYSMYFMWKQRLIALEQQRDDMIRLYGKVSFMDELSDILEKCWRFESTHPNVSKFATNKLGNVMNDFRKMNSSKSEGVNTKKATPNHLKKKTSKPTTPVVTPKSNTIPSAQSGIKVPSFSSVSSDNASNLTLKSFNPSRMSITPDQTLSNKLLPTISIKPKNSKQFDCNSSITPSDDLLDKGSFFVEETFMGQKLPTLLPEPRTTIEESNENLPIVENVLAEDDHPFVERDDIESQFVASKNDDKVQVIGDRAIHMADDLLTDILNKYVKTITPDYLLNKKEP